MKVLWSQNGDSQDEANADREVTKTFNPEAQIFQPIEASRKSVSPYGSRNGALGSPDGSPFGNLNQIFMLYHEKYYSISPSCNSMLIYATHHVQEYL